MPIGELLSNPMISTEARLVYALARGGDQLLGQRLEDLSWERLLSIAADENALVATHQYVSNLRSSDVPQNVRLQLACLALGTKSRMMRLESRLEESLIALERAGIVVTLLKGAALAKTVYGSFVSRPMNDIDLLISSDEIERAREIMLRTGWAPDATLPGDLSYAEHHHLPPLVDSTGSGHRMELHSALLPRGNPFAISLSELQRNSREIRVGPVRARVLSPTHHAVYIAIHWAWSHEFRGAAWHAFRDLGILARHDQLDWAAFVATAKTWRAATCAYWTLRLGQALTGMSTPRHVMIQLRPRLPEAVLSRLERHLALRVLHGRACPSVRLSQLLWSLVICPSQSGHGAARPWLVSRDLRKARIDVSSPAADGRTSQRVGRLVDAAMYLVNIA